jgi:hypothetical protein
MTKRIMDWRGNCDVDVQVGAERWVVVVVADRHVRLGVVGYDVGREVQEPRRIRWVGHLFPH